MRTCSTLCASGVGIATASIGLLVAREDSSEYSPVSHPIPSTSSFLQPARTVSEGQNGKVRPSKARTGEKRKITPRVGFGVESLPDREEEGKSIPRIGTPNSLFRRLSNSISSSRSVSRPGSAAMSTNSVNMLSGSSSPIPTTNKLVKRASFRDSNGSLQSSASNSRLPIAAFRRPLTSYDRSMSLQYTSSRPESDRMSIDEESLQPREIQLRQFFTPRVSGIPKPIKRIYPDRNYTPILVSGNASVRPAQVEVDYVFGLDEHDAAGTAGTASSPLPGQIPEFREGDTPRSQRRWKPTGGKLLRRGRSRIVSAPATTMGNRTSTEERPAKRRDLTSNANRSIYSSASSNHGMDIDMHHQVHLHLTGDMPDSPADLTSSQHRLPRPPRISAAHSELASTVDSDSEHRSIGDDSTDYQSDAIYDSNRTRTTRSSSGRRGPHIEKIFAESPNLPTSRSTKLKDLLSDGSFASMELTNNHRNGTIEEEDSSISTPVRSLRDNSVTSTPSARPQQIFKSSPPMAPRMQDLDEIDWDAFDGDVAEDRHSSQYRSPAMNNHRIERSLPFRFGTTLQQPHSATSDITPIRQNGFGTDRTNLFDWSESQPSPSATNSPPRPKTTYGIKKGPDSRGSRSTGRRAPSGIHARSHSVPVVPDVGGRRDNIMANKFGTWGVGSKGIIEDWNDEFDFDSPPEPVPETFELDERRIDSGHEMFVPQSIREQQQNVLTNIGLLREWGLLIEELKELRIRAVALDMMNGPYASDWLEVDGMIELADQESEERTLEPRRTPPSSPGFDYDAFDDTATLTRPQRLSGRMSDAMLDPESSTMFPRLSPQAAAPQSTSAARARKDSEAVARSVIEALQARRSVSDPTNQSPAQYSRNKKVPFDTATLRHIVPYVNRLKKTVKEGLRETEGLRTSPNRSGPRRSMDRAHGREDREDEPAFRSIFNEPQPNEGVVRRKSRRSEAATDHDGSEGGDLANRMQGMNLPRQ